MDVIKLRRHLCFFVIQSELPLRSLNFGDAKLTSCLAFRETTGALTSTRFKALWWIRKEKWSTGCLGNGTKASTAVSRHPPNASGGQVGTSSPSPPSAVSSHEPFLRELFKNEQHMYDSISFLLFSLLARLYAHRLWAVLRLHQICHWTQWTLPWAEGCSAPNRCPIQARSEVQHWPLHSSFINTFLQLCCSVSQAFSLLVAAHHK